jgi:hypothetical protein
MFKRAVKTDLSPEDKAKEFKKSRWQLLLICFTCAIIWLWIGINASKFYSYVIHGITGR